MLAHRLHKWGLKTPQVTESPVSRVTMIKSLAEGMNAGIAWITSAVTAEPVSGQAATTTCPACGGPIRDDWRLCPHCGRMTETEVGSDEGE